MNQKIVDLISDIIGNRRPCLGSEWLIIKTALKESQKTSTNKQSESLLYDNNFRERFRRKMILAGKCPVCGSYSQA